MPRSHPIKGNEDSGIYHLPNGASYSVTNPETAYTTGKISTVLSFQAKLISWQEPLIELALVKSV